MPAAEECDDGLDNDCDGEADEASAGCGACPDVGDGACPDGDDGGGTSTDGEGEDRHEPDTVPHAPDDQGEPGNDGDEPDVTVPDPAVTPESGSACGCRVPIGRSRSRHMSGLVLVCLLALVSRRLQNVDTCARPRSSFRPTG